MGALWNFTKHLHQNPPEPHKVSAPEPSGTSQGICTGTLRNLTKHLLRPNPPEPHKVSAPEPSGTGTVLAYKVVPPSYKLVYNLINYRYIT